MTNIATAVEKPRKINLYFNEGKQDLVVGEYTSGESGSEFALRI